VHFNRLQELIMAEEEKETKEETASPEGKGGIGRKGGS
jgi:hypothetical protein